MANLRPTPVTFVQSFFKIKCKIKARNFPCLLEIHFQNQNNEKQTPRDFIHLQFMCKDWKWKYRIMANLQPTHVPFIQQFFKIKDKKTQKFPVFSKSIPKTKMKQRITSDFSAYRFCA